MSSQELLKTPPPEPGRIEWIGLRPARGAPIKVVAEAEVVAGHGLRGDRAFAAQSNPMGKRHVTAIQGEDLAVIASCVRREQVTARQTRRNMVIAGLNLLACSGAELHVGIGPEPVRLGVTGPCTPCAKMDQTVGPGGFQAMRGRGGLTLRALTSGVIRVGDPVRVVHPEPVDGD